MSSTDIQFRFNIESKSKNIPEAIKIAQFINGEIKENFCIVKFSNLQDKILIKLLKLVGHLSKSQISIDKSNWINTRYFKIKENKIIKLILENQELSSYPDFINHITTLKTLTLQNNNITSIPNSIGTLSNLEYLDLSKNEIYSLPDSIGNLVNLKRLNLDYNCLKTLPKSIINLKKLKSLNIYPGPSIVLENIPSSLKNISSIIKPEIFIHPEAILPITDKFSFSNLSFDDSEYNSLSKIQESDTSSSFHKNFTDILRKYELESFTENIFNLIKYKIRIKNVPSEDRYIPIGLSKFGGSPDVPEGFKWPYWKGRPLSFLVQIDLAIIQEKIKDFKIKKIETISFPKTEGFLYFFFNYHQEVWGENSEDKGCGRVIFEKVNKSELKRTPNPSVYKSYTYKPNALAFYNDISLPIGGLHVESGAIKDLVLSQREEDAYYHFIRDYLQWDTRWDANWLFGYPVGIYNNEYHLPYLCESCFSNSDDIKETEKWTLLMQLGEKLGERRKLDWGNGGYLQYWIRDLEEGDFEKTWAIIESINSNFKFYKSL